MLHAVFAGPSAVLVSDGKTSILIDGFFSRPSRARRLVGRVRPDVRRIDDALVALGMSRLAAVLASHSGLDPALDAPVIAERTGALLAGPAAIRMIQEGYGLGRLPFALLESGHPLDFGSMRITPIAGRWSPAAGAREAITRPVALPARAGEFRPGPPFSFHVDHPTGSLLVLTHSGPEDPAHDGPDADLVLLGDRAIADGSAVRCEEHWARAIGGRAGRRVHVPLTDRPSPAHRVRAGSRRTPRDRTVTSPGAGVDVRPTPLFRRIDV